MKGYQVWVEYQASGYNGDYTESNADEDNMEIWLDKDAAQHFVDRLNCEEEMRYYLTWKEQEERKKIAHQHFEDEFIKAVNAGISKAVLIRTPSTLTPTEFKMPWGHYEYYLEELEVIE